MSGQSFADMYPFTSHFHATPGGRMHYLDEGAGRPVVMVHGNPTWSFFYRDLARNLRETQRVIVPDHIGCGYSDKPQDYAYTLRAHIDNLTDLLGATIPATTEADDRFDLIVHDWGGAIGFGYATAYPERIRRIVILNTAAFLMARIPWRINVCRLPILGALAVRSGNVFAGAATHLTTTKPLSATVKAGFLKPYDSWANRIAVHRFVQDIPLHADVPSYAVVQEIESRLDCFRDTEILIQWGEQDWCFDMNFLKRWQEIYPHAEVDVYPDAGHYLLEDAGEKIIPRVQAFLSESQREKNNHKKNSTPS